MNLDEARALLATITYRPGWTLEVVDEPGADGLVPTLAISRIDGRTEYAPLPTTHLYRMTRRDLAFWAHGRLVDIEVRDVRAAFRVDGQRLDELEDL